MFRRRLRVGLFLAGLAALYFYASVRHDDGRPSQRYGDFEAVVDFNRWYYLALEVYAQDRMGVVPSYTEASAGRGQGKRTRFRILGIPIGRQDDFLGLGDQGYPANKRQQQEVFRYILQTKMQSPDRADRLWVISKVWMRDNPYPGAHKDLLALLEDSDWAVRQAAKARLEHIKALRPPGAPASQGPARAGR